MKCCVSTCLFNADKYKKTFLDLAESVDKYLPQFDLVIYHDKSMTDIMKYCLEKFKCVKLIEMPESKGREGCFWRYLSYDKYDLCFFRDIDIPIEENDIIIINDFVRREFNIAWIFTVHTRKPFPKQGFLMGGIFLMKKTKLIPSMKQLIDIYPEFEEYGTDEEFLARMIYPRLKPICYYESERQTVKSTVFIPGKYETYCPLNNNYSM